MTHWRVIRAGDVGTDRTDKLLRYVDVLRHRPGKNVKMAMLPLQPGDVPDTTADASDLSALVSYRPQVQVEEGVKKFIDWYKQYYGVEFDAVGVPEN